MPVSSSSLLDRVGPAALALVVCLPGAAERLGPLAPDVERGRGASRAEAETVADELEAERHRWYATRRSACRDSACRTSNVLALHTSALPDRSVESWRARGERVRLPALEGRVAEPSVGLDWRYVAPGGRASVRRPLEVDGEGRFELGPRFAAVAAGRVYLELLERGTARRAGYAAVDLSSRGPVDVGSVALVDVRPLLGGVVRDSDGAPLAGVRIVARAVESLALSDAPDGVRVFEHEVYSGPDGSFAVEGFGGDEAPARVQLVAFARPRSPLVQLVRTAQFELDLRWTDARDGSGESP